MLEDTFELAPIRTLFTILLNCGANLEQIYFFGGNTLLIFAVERANLGLAGFLLKKGANINAQNRVRNTPLHAAIECSNLELARFLLQNGAGINAQNSDGNTPLHLAIQHYEALENIKKVLSEKTYLEQQAKQPASNALLSTKRASSSRMSSNRSAFLQGIRHAFSKKRQQEKKNENPRPGP